MAATVVSEILAFAAREGNKVLQTQVRMKAPLWDKLEHVPMGGQVGVINVIAAGQQSAKFITDGGTRSSGTSNTPVQGQVSPAFADAPLLLNNGVLMTLRGLDDSANYMDGQLRSAGDTLAQMIGTSFYASAGEIAEIDGYAGDAGFEGSPLSCVVTVPSPAGLKEGMSVVFSDTSASKAYTLRVAGVTLSATTLGASVTLTDDVAGVTNDASLDLIVPVSGDKIFQRGSFVIEDGSATAVASGLSPTNLTDLAGSGAIYGISAPNCAATGFVGQTWTSVGDASQEAFLLRMKRVHQKSGEMPDLVCVGPITSAVLGFSALTAASAGGLGSAVGQTRRMVDGKLDKYGRGISSESGVSLGGKEVLEDVNLGDTSAFLLSKQFTKVGVWQDIEADKQGGDTLLVKQDAFAKVAFFSAAYNLMCSKRSTVGKISGLTTDFGA